MKKIESLIEEALRKEPSFKLGEDFKDRVIKAVRRKEKANQRKLYIWMFLGTLLIFGSGFVTITLYVPTLIDSLKSIKGINQIVPFGVFVGLLIVVIQYLDKVLIKDKVIRI